MDPSGQDSCSKCGKAFGASPSYLFIGKRYCLECFRAAREEASKRAHEQEKTYDAPAAEPGAGVYRLDDILPALRKDADPEPVYGTALKEKIGEYLAAWRALSPERTQAEQARINTAWKALVTEMNLTPLIVPFSYRDDEPGTEDKALHCTAAAAMRLNRDAIVYRTGRMTPAQTASLFWTHGPDGELSVDYDWWDISRFAGSEGWHFAADSAGRGPMFFHRAKADGKQYLGVYTSIGAMKSLFPDAPCPHAAVITAGDVRELVLRDPSLTGIILDPNTEYHCMIPRAYIR